MARAQSAAQQPASSAHYSWPAAQPAPAAAAGAGRDEGSAASDEWDEEALLLPVRTRERLLLLLGVLAQLGLLAGAVAVSWIWWDHPRADRWMWAGGVTSSSFELRLKGYSELRVSRSRDLSSPELLQPLSGNPDVVDSVSVTGLQPTTEYWYGSSSSDVGRVRTWPTGASGEPYALSIAFASCASTGSAHRVFNDIAEGGHDLFIATGDLHYRDINANSPAAYRTGFDYVHGSAGQRALFRSAPVAYMWDDHDFGPDESNSESPGREAAQASYREHVPHPPLPSSSGSVYHAFTAGRVRFVAPDLRSEMLPNGQMIGPAQQAWLAQEIASAGNYALLVLLLGTPWVGKEKPGDDGWFGHTAAREWLSQRIAAARSAGGPVGGYANIIAIAGDAHMAAFDDGSHTDYSGTGNAGIPLIHAAPLDRIGKAKGGPYSAGCYGWSVKNTHQYAVLRISDNGGAAPDAVCIDVELRSAGELMWASGPRCGPLVQLGRGAPGNGTCTIKTMPPAELALCVLATVAWGATLIVAGVLHCSNGCCRTTSACIPPPRGRPTPCCGWRRLWAWVFAGLTSVVLFTGISAASGHTQIPSTPPPSRSPQHFWRQLLSCSSGCR
eukprot:TRINITY_DN28928_c0_g1_i1.p1 TRINITY_DN28928_c0_g1~~TRINITY_DN28928_c0_g1_i1.p1  ORF type:complete len:635 (+),score=96.85 TRINITY_DN28928_c0_g1_i1:72-1907(+)